jgi:hypothetical protein
MKWFKLLYGPIIFFVLTGCAGAESYGPEAASEEISTEEAYEEAVTEEVSEESTGLSEIEKEAYTERFEQKISEFSDLYQLLLDESLDKEMKHEIIDACQDLFKNKGVYFKVNQDDEKIHSFLEKTIKNKGTTFKIQSIGKMKESTETGKHELLRLSTSISGYYNGQAYIGTIKAIVLKRTKLFGNKKEQVVELVLSNITIAVPSTI